MVAHTLSGRLREVRRAQRRSAARTAGSTRQLVVVAFGPSAAWAVGLAVLVAVVLVASDGGLGGLTAAVGAVWLAAHQVPVTVSESAVGVLPLAPTIAMIAVVARVTARASARRAGGDVAAVALAAIGGPLAITVVSLALVMDGSTVLPIAPPDVVLALACTIAVHATGAALGIGWPRRRRIAAAVGAAPWAWDAVRAATVGVLGLLTAGAAIVVIRLIWQWSTVGSLIDAGHGFVGGIGLTVLSALYLPNIVIGAAAMLLGADVRVGAAGGDVFAAHVGSLPALPVAAVTPQSTSAAAPAMMLLTVLIAVVVATRVVHLDTRRAARTAAATAGLIAVAVVVLTWVGGGELGGLGSAGADVLASGVYALLWFGAIGIAVVMIHAVLPTTRAARVAANRDSLVGARPWTAHVEGPVVEEPVVEEPVDGEPADAPPGPEDESPAADRLGEPRPIPGDDSPTEEFDDDVIPQRAPASLVFGHEPVWQDEVRGETSDPGAGPSTPDD